MVSNLNFTKLERLWQTTSIFLKMEDDLNIFKMEDDLNILKMEDDLNIFENGRQTQSFKVRLGKTTLTNSEQPKTNKNLAKLGDGRGQNPLLWL